MDRRTVRRRRGRDGRRAVRDDRVRGRTGHVARGGRQPATHRLAVDRGEKVRGHRGGHLRVRAADGPLANRRVRGTVQQGVAVVWRSLAADGHRLLRLVRLVVERPDDQLQRVVARGGCGQRQDQPR